METSGNKVPLNTRISPEIKAALDKFCSEYNIPQTDAVANAIRDLLMNKATDNHPDYAADIAVVTNSLQIISDKYLTAIDAVDVIREQEREKTRMATEEARSEVARLKAEIEELRIKKDEDAKTVAEADRDLQLTKEENVVLKDRIRVMQQERTTNETLTVELTSMREQIAGLYKELAQERAEKKDAYSKIASLSETFLANASNTQREHQSLLTRCKKMEKILTDAGIPLPQ